MNKTPNEIGLEAVFEIANRMGVEIYFVSDLSLVDDRDYGKFWGSPSRRFGAAHRVVWCSEDDPSWTDLLHEVSHAVWCGPGRDPGCNNETIGQDQWERHVVKSLVRSGLLTEKLERDHFIFQSDSIRMEDRIVGHEDFDSWKYGEYISVLSGASRLEEDGAIVPTWDLPNFDLVSKDVDKDLMNWKWSRACRM